MVKYQVVHGDEVGPHADWSQRVLRLSDRYGGMGGAGGGAVGSDEARAGVAGGRAGVEMGTVEGAACHDDEQDTCGGNEPARRNEGYRRTEWPRQSLEDSLLEEFLEEARPASVQPGHYVGSEGGGGAAGGQVAHHLADGSGMREPAPTVRTPLEVLA